MSLDGVDPDVAARWRRVTKRFGQELGVNSGYRDPAKNARVGGAKKSQHMHGKALDIDVAKLPNDERIRLIEIASSEGFNGVGVYNNSVHFDTAGRRAWGPSHSRDSLPEWAASTIQTHMQEGFKVAQAEYDPEAFRAVIEARKPARTPPKAEAKQGYDPEAFRAVIEARKAPAQADQPSQPKPPEGMVQLSSGYMLDTNAIARRAVKEGKSLDHALGLASHFMKGVPFVGEFTDEALGVMNEFFGGEPGLAQEMARAYQKAFEEANPNQAMAAQVAGGVVGSLPALAAAPAAGAALPASMAGQVGAGLAIGAAGGGVEGFVSGYGAGDGRDRMESARERAIAGAAIGGGFGAAAPLLGRAGQAVYDTFRPNRTGAAALAHNVSPEAVEITGRMLQNDAGPNMAARLSAPDAMLADAGPASAGLLDTVIQRAGPGGSIARDAVEDRATRAAGEVTGALDEALGPLGVTTSVPKSAGLKRLYDAAYSRPINYAGPNGQELESLLDAVPVSIVKRADALMQMERVPSAQRMVSIADDGTESITKMPDVRQWDYITRSLNDVARSGDGKGALGGNTNEGRVYKGLAREIRTILKDENPAYATALSKAASEIAIKNAGDLGEAALRPSMTRGDLAEEVADMGAAEMNALRRGVREYIDDTLARTKAALTDGNMDAREAVAGLKELSSRASRQKLEIVLGRGAARLLVKKLENSTRAFETRAALATNSKTFARQSMDRAISDVTEPSAFGKLIQGNPMQAARRALQTLTKTTPAQRRQVEERIAGEIATLLTSTRGPRAMAAAQEFVRALEQDAAGAALADSVRRAITTATAASAVPATRLQQSR